MIDLDTKGNTQMYEMYNRLLFSKFCKIDPGVGQKCMHKLSALKYYVIQICCSQGIEFFTQCGF